MIRMLGLERPAALGQSFGGMVAADLAATFPRLFSRLVLLSPMGLWRDDAPIPLMEMVSGSPEDAPKYLFAHPESEQVLRRVLRRPGHHLHQRDRSVVAPQAHRREQHQP